MHKYFLESLPHSQPGLGSCEEFSEGSCPLYEDNILEISHVDTAHLCQERCKVKEDTTKFRDTS